MEEINIDNNNDSMNTENNNKMKTITTTTATTITNIKRDGNREYNQLRAMETEQGLLNRADGSARWIQGKTSVLAAVYGPGHPKFSWKEEIDRATIEVTCKPNKGQPAGIDREAEYFQGWIVSHTPEPCCCRGWIFPPPRHCWEWLLT